MSTPQLFWLGRDGIENAFPLVASEVLIGRRADSDVVLENQHVSRHHAKLLKTADGYLIKDLESTYGTFVNESRIKTQLLKHGDTISLGKSIDLHFVATR
jgi:ABC transport system ATP-binding/permease protein